MKIETLPVVLIDSREQAPLHIEAYPVEVAGLPVGDYGILGFSDWENPAFIVERKSLSDLCGSLGHGRERFMREIEKMRQFRFRGLVIEGSIDQVETHQYRGLINPTSLLASLDAIEVRAGIHVSWCGSPNGASRQLCGWIRQFIRGVAKDYERLRKGAQTN